MNLEQLKKQQNKENALYAEIAANEEHFSVMFECGASTQALIAISHRSLELNSKLTEIRCK